MSDPRTCAGCGTEIGGDAPSGHCPACLMKLGLGAVLEAGAPDELSPGAGAGRRFGDYELLEPLGRGGMGVVYRARQVSLDRLVALKMIGHAHLASPLALQRFQTEAETAAKLDHPNIVPIYEVGEHEGQPFFSMKLVEGRSLAERIAGEKGGKGQKEKCGAATPRVGLPRKFQFSISNSQFSIATLVAALARAVHYAHQHGVLHRDLKPGNILLDAQGTPYLTDFGVAKMVERPGELMVESGGSTPQLSTQSPLNSLTATGAVLGTPSYMAPEQATGGRASTASDIYSLGAILYELLTGRPPFHASTPLETMRQVTEQQPTPPTTLNALIPRDLATICLKCLEKEPAKRYASAEALAEDLERFTRDEPILARPVRAHEKFTRWCRRNPKLAGSLSALLIVFTAGFFGVLLQWKRAVEGEIALRENLYVADMSVANSALKQGDLGRAARLLQSHVPGIGEADLRGFEWRYLWGQCRGDEIHAFERFAHYVTAVAYSPDGGTLAISSFDGRLQIRDAASHRLTTNMAGITGGVPRLEFSPDGTLLAAGAAEVHVFAVSNWSKIATLKSVYSGCPMAFAPDGQTLAVREADGIAFWDTQTFQLVGNRVPCDLRDDAGFLAFSPDGRLLVVTAGTKVKVWNWRQPSVVADFSDPFFEPIKLAVSHSAGVMIAPDWNGRTKLWSFDPLHEIPSTISDPYFILAVAFSPDGKRLATGGAGQFIKVWELASQREITRLKGHHNEIWALGFSSDGNTLASASKDQTARIWAIKESPSTNFITNGGVAVEFQGAGDSVFVLKTNGVLLRWDTSTRHAKQLLQLPGVSLESLQSDRIAISPDGRIGAVAHGGDSIEIWNLDSATMVQRLPNAWGTIKALGISPNGSTVVAECSRLENRKHRVAVEAWNLDQRRSVWILPEVSADGFGHFAFSPDDRTLAVTTSRTVQLLDLARGRVLTTLKGHQWAVGAIAFSPDGRLVATGGTDNELRLWDADSGSLKALLHGHRQGISGLAFSIDGRTLASGSETGIIKLWSVRTGRELFDLEGFDESQHVIRFSPDGRSLVALGREPPRGRGSVALLRVRILLEIESPELAR